MKHVQRLFVLFVLPIFFSFATPVHAFEIRNGETVRVEQGQVIEGSLFAAGTTIVVDGTVHGDIFCAGQHVLIAGVVDGDVICGGQSVEIQGVVGGSVRVAGQTIDISGAVKRNITTASQSLVISKQGIVGGEILAGGKSMTIDGVVGKGIIAAIQKASINGTVLGDMRLLVDALSFGEKATVSGTVRYTSEKEAFVSKTASISGVLSQTLPEKKEQRRVNQVMSPDSRASWPMNAWPAILFYLVLGCMIVALFPLYTARVYGKMTSAPVSTGLKGLLFLVAVPIFAVLLFITLLGIPLALPVLLIYALAVGACRVFVAGIVGKYLLDTFKVKQKTNPLLQMLVGVPVLWLITKAPFIGGLVGFVAICWGLGGMILGLRSTKK